MKWVNLPKYPNYQISDTGLVKRIQHISQHKLYGDRLLPERMLNPAKNHDGYMRVKIAKKFVFVHVLVLEGFVGERPKGMQACHNNGIPDDNRLINLRWDSPKNNINDRRFHGTYQWGFKNPNGKYSDEVRKKIITSSLPAKELSKELGISCNAIYAIRFRAKNSKGEVKMRIEDIS